MAQIVTITNPLTGQPAQVDQLEHTAQEIDGAIARALPGGAIDIALQNKATILTANTYLYVAPSGSDTTGDGSQSNPFRTIQHAVDMIPPVLNGKRLDIILAPGVYDEDVIITGKTGGGEYSIRILGASTKDDAVNYQVRSIRLFGIGMSYGRIRGIKFTGNASGTYDIYAMGSACVLIDSCIMESATKYCIVSDGPYSVMKFQNCTISNKTKVALIAESACIVQAFACTGENNAVVFQSGGGSGFGGIIFDCGKNTISGTVAEVKQYGGQIFK